VAELIDRGMVFLDGRTGRLAMHAALAQSLRSEPAAADDVKAATLRFARYYLQLVCNLARAVAGRPGSHSASGRA
jgi:hypothetical protein